MATRMLAQNGLNAKVISGGMLSFAHNYMFDNSETLPAAGRQALRGRFK